MARSKTETKALVALLEQDWETPEVLAETIIDTLDELRATKTRYVGVMQIGQAHPIYVGVGPFPGSKSAENALRAHPAAGMAYKLAVVPVTSPRGLTLALGELDAPPSEKGDFALVQEDAALFKLGWGGDTKSRKQYLDRLTARAG